MTRLRWAIAALAALALLGACGGDEPLLALPDRIEVVVGDGPVALDVLANDVGESAELSWVGQHQDLDARLFENAVWLSSLTGIHGTVVELPYRISMDGRESASTVAVEFVRPVRIDVQPSAVDFGDVLLGQAVTRSVRVTVTSPESGDAELVFGLADDDFSIAPGACQTVELNAPCEVEVTFDPIKRASSSTLLRVGFGDLMAELRLSGRGVIAELVASRTSIDLGRHFDDESPVGAEFTLTNTGDVNVVPSMAPANGLSNSVSSCGSLGVGESCLVSVAAAFVGTEGRVDFDTTIVTDVGSTTPVEVVVEWEIRPRPNFILDPSGTRLDPDSRDVQITFENVGNVALQPTITGRGSEYVRIDSSLCWSVEAGDSCRIDLSLSAPSTVVVDDRFDLTVSAADITRSIGLDVSVPPRVDFTLSASSPVMTPSNPQVVIDAVNTGNVQLFVDPPDGSAPSPGLRYVDVIESSCGSEFGESAVGRAPWLQPGESCRIVLQLDAPAETLIDETIELTARASGLTRTISFDIEVIPPPTFSLDVASIHFPDNNMIREVEVTNTGAVPLTGFVPPEYRGWDEGGLGWLAVHFTTCDTVVKPGASCEIVYVLIYYPSTPDGEQVPLPLMTEVEFEGASQDLTVYFGTILR